MNEQENLIVMCNSVNRMKWLFDKTCELFQDCKGAKSDKKKPEIIIGKFRIRFLLNNYKEINKVKGIRPIKFINDCHFEKIFIENKGELR